MLDACFSDVHRRETLTLKLGVRDEAGHEIFEAAPRAATPSSVQLTCTRSLGALHFATWNEPFEVDVTVVGDDDDGWCASEGEQPDGNRWRRPAPCLALPRTMASRESDGSGRH